MGYGQNLELRNTRWNNCTEAATRFLYPDHLSINGIITSGTWYSGTGTSYVISLVDAAQFVNIQNVYAVGQRHAVTMNSDTGHGTTRMVTGVNINVDETQQVSNGACVDAHENSQFINYSGVTCRTANASASWCAAIRGYHSSISDFNCYGAGGINLANSAFDRTYNRVGPGIVTITPGSTLSGVHVNGAYNDIHDVKVIAADAANDTGTWNAFETYSSISSGGAYSHDNHFNNVEAYYPRGQGFSFYATTASTLRNFDVTGGHAQGIVFTGRVADSQGSNNNFIGPGQITTGTYGLYNSSSFNAGNYYAGVICTYCPSGLVGSAGGTPWVAGSGSRTVFGPFSAPTDGNLALWSDGALIDGGAVPVSPNAYKPGLISGQTGTVAYATVYTATAAGKYCVTNPVLYPTTLDSNASPAWLVSLYARFPGAYNYAGSSISRIAQVNVHTGAESTFPPACAWLDVNQTVQIGIFPDSGARTDGVFNYSYLVVKE